MSAYRQRILVQHAMRELTKKVDPGASVTRQVCAERKLSMTFCVVR